MANSPGTIEAAEKDVRGCSQPRANLLSGCRATDCRGVGVNAGKGVGVDAGKGAGVDPVEVERQPGRQTRAARTTVKVISLCLIPHYIIAHQRLQRLAWGHEPSTG